MSSKNIEIQNITLMDEVETNEAIKIKRKYQLKYFLIFLLPFILFIVSFGLMASKGFVFNSDEMSILIFFIISLILTIVGASFYIKLMKPFYKLYKLAVRNDRIRHEEKIRENERRRLRRNFDNEYSKKDIENSYSKTFE